MMTELSTSKVMIGHKLRRLRLTLKLSQSDMATELGISASYLNLLENNVRPVTVPILFRLGQTYDVDLRDMAEDDSVRLIAILTEIFADRSLDDIAMSRRDIQQLANGHPTAATALIHLYRAFEVMREAAHKGSHDMHDAPPDTPIASPLENVRQIIEAESNYFPELEQAAQEFLHDLDRRMPEAKNAHAKQKQPYLIQYLETQFKVKTRILSQKIMDNLFRDFDLHRARLSLSENLSGSQRVFQIAAQIALLGYRDVIDKVITRIAPDIDQDTQTLLHMALSGYFAGAVMMPYQAFFDAAHETRHDLYLLGHQFSANFEQVCHRLTTLNKQNQRGIPFFFLRVDEAGYISKRLSAGGMEFAKHGGACGRWIPHKAFSVPNEILIQAAQLEEGQKLLTIACTHHVPRTQPAHYGTPIYAIALGCDLKYARDICYADSHVNIKSPVLTPIGLGCRVCERQNCQHRGALPRGQKMRFDLSKRYSSLFDR